MYKENIIKYENRRNPTMLQFIFRKVLNSPQFVVYLRTEPGHKYWIVQEIAGPLVTLKLSPKIDDTAGRLDVLN
jgi:hypothetical protein